MGEVVWDWRAKNEEYTGRQEHATTYRLLNLTPLAAADDGQSEQDDVFFEGRQDAVLSWQSIPPVLKSE
jgi:hypothetical protein